MSADMLQPLAAMPDEATALPWVVAVGASAGGLDALQRFFAATRPPTRAAFVVIQHLAPDHRSMMPELLARHAGLPVQEAVAGESLVADRVYLMPPGVLMTIDQHRLVFSPRPQHGVSLPIDQFFRSLAATMPERSIAIVLSGSGSDGAVGAAALRAAGGFVMAQLPETAKFDSMPRSVAAATAVDAVLAPEALALKAIDLVQGGRGPLAEVALLADTPAAKPALQRLFDTLRQRCGVDFGQYKLPTVMRRIERRLAVLDCASVSDYADLVDGSEAEAEALRRELLIPVTGFFRDAAAFDALGRLLRSLLRQRPPGQPLRVWCAGCATGEEAYSLVIAALEACADVQVWPGVKVFATDIDPRFLAVGSAGSYPAGAAEAIAPELLARHFSVLEDRIVVKPELRQMVLFARHNLLEDAPFTKMDLVVCRNVLIYFQAEPQDRVMRRLQYALVHGGALFLGHSESLGALQPDFQAVDTAHRLYRLVRPVLTSLAVREGFGRWVPGRPRRVAGAAAAGVPDVVELGLGQLVQAYVPLTLLVSPSRQLLHAWGPTQRYLRLGEGQADLDVLRLLPPRLAAVAGHALHRVQRERVEHAAPPVSLLLDGQDRTVRVVVRPVGGRGEGPEAGEAEPCALLTLEELPATAPAAEPVLAEAELDRITLMERELAESRLTLQASIEELEAANEELQATNEELMSSNEELQSTNEELQSVNEELYTVNAEYNAKLDLVNALHADLDGMSQATGIATLFVDAELALVRFTPEATLLFRLRPADIGRSIEDFSCQLDYPDLVADLRRALGGAAPFEREVAGQEGARYLARVVGYGDAPNAPRRAVLSLVDVSRLRAAQRLQMLLDALPDHIALLDAQGTIRQVNHAWEAFASANGGDTTGTGVGASYLAAMARSTHPRTSELLRELQRVLSGTRRSLQVTYPCHSPTEKRWFVLNATAVRPGAAEPAGGAVVTHRDVTRWIGATPEDLDDD